MIWDYAENIFQLLAELVALLLCLFYYISSKRREWIYGLLFFLCGVLSSYFFTAYLIIMGAWPKGFDLMTYAGWNLAFLFLFLLVRYRESPEEKRYFHPMMLFPLVLDLIMLAVFLFVPASVGERQIVTSNVSYFLNNFWLVIICTFTGAVSLQRLFWYRKMKAEGVNSLPVPWISLGAFITVFASFTMWISTSLNGPSIKLYYPFSFLCSLSYLALVWFINRSENRDAQEEPTTFDRKFQNVLKASSLGMVIIFSVGGVCLGSWIRDMIMQHIDLASESSIYDIIQIVLFVISLVVIIFVVTVIFVVYSGQRAAENSKLREARQIAERSNAAKSEFLAAMSHEIRTPINAVLGMNEIVMRGHQLRRQKPALHYQRHPGYLPDRIRENGDPGRKLYAQLHAERYLQHDQRPGNGPEPLLPCERGPASPGQPVRRLSPRPAGPAEPPEQCCEIYGARLRHPVRLFGCGSRI